MGNCIGSCSGTSVEDETETENEIKNNDIAFDYVSEFIVPKMDCPSEENIIRLSLDSLKPEVGLNFDIPNRLVTVFHGENLEDINQRLTSLGFGASLNGTRECNGQEDLKAMLATSERDGQEAFALKCLLGINATMFAVEFFMGWLAQSTGLIADSLDMFADAAVYGLALYAVGRSVQLKLRAAHLSGWLQVILALGALSEVLRRLVFGSEPASTLMIGIGCVALLANIACLMLIYKNKDGGAHMKASWIFSANDVIANLGVILAGVLVALTGTPYPDLVIGVVIAAIVLNGARRILQLKQ